MNDAAPVPVDDFAALAREAEQTDADNGAPQAASVAADAPAAVGELEEARVIIGLICLSVNALWPFLAPIYTEEVQGRLADVSAPLLKKYNVTAGGLFERYKEEIAFSLVAVPLATATLHAFKAHRAAPVPAQADDAAATPAAA